MLIVTKALVLRETGTSRDDSFFTLLTQERGVISAFAKKTGRGRKKLGGVEVLCYADVVLYYSRGKYIINDFEILELFFPLRQDLEKLALAQYFAQLLQYLAPAEEPAGPFLRLALNTLHFLAEGSRENGLLKAIFELQLLSMAGFMPDLVGCTRCGCYEHAQMYFSPGQGALLCGGCMEEKDRGSYYRVTPGVLAAMRYILYSPAERSFSFRLGGKSLPALQELAQRYMLYHVDRSFSALEFYLSLVNPLEEPDTGPSQALENGVDLGPGTEPLRP